jgi:hypothetical protein
MSAINRLWSWQRFGWLLLLLAISLALLVGIFVLVSSSYFLQLLYFGFLDHTHRNASVSLASFTLISLGLLTALGVIAVVVGAFLAVINPAFRKHTRTASIMASAFVLFGCAVVTVVVIVRSKPEREIPVGRPAWTANLDSIPTDANTFAATRLMVFPNAEHLVIASASEIRTLDTSSGKIIAERQVEGREPYVFASPEGNVILSSGGQLQLLAPDLHALNISFSLLSGEANRVSPSGARIAWQRYSKDPPKTIFLDTKSFKPAETFTSCIVEAMNDHFVANSVVLVDEGNVPAINICEPGSATHIFYRGPLQPYYFFYLNNEVMLMINGNRLRVIDSKGKLMGEDEWPGEEVNFAGASRDGRRFAIATERLGFGDPAYINRESIIIYDTSTIQPVEAIHSDRVPYLQSLSAFSPDGKAFATGSNPTISYFRLP